MQKRMSSKRIGYGIFLLLILALTGFILYPFMTEKFVLFAVLAIIYIILMIAYLYYHDKYIRPIDTAAKTMDKILQGNYQAQIRQQATGSIAHLNDKINQLAQNLHTLSRQEQIQAEQLSTVIENSESSLVMIDEKGYIHLVNRKFLNMFGGKTKDYVDHLYYDVLENEEIHQTVQSTFLYEKKVKSLFSMKQNNEDIYFEIIGAPIFNERNILKGAVLVIYDITEFKNIEVMRKDFVANVSHELKTPITSIRGFSETLLHGAADDEAVRQQFLQIIFDESRRIQHLIDDLLILSRLEREDADVQLTIVDVDLLLTEVLPIVERHAKEQVITLSVDVQAGIHFEADVDKVKQILLNLLTNAISYTPSEGKVSLSIQARNNEIEFEVVDTGIGIPKEALPRVFERFYRVDKARSRNTGGTGLGLAIVKHIVEVHEGDIKVDSVNEQGTTFTVRLPKYHTQSEDGSF